jgi:hypothetical protein
MKSLTIGLTVSTQEKKLIRDIWRGILDKIVQVLDKFSPGRFLQPKVTRELTRAALSKMRMGNLKGETYRFRPGSFSAWVQNIVMDKFVQAWERGLFVRLGLFVVLKIAGDGLGVI